MLPAAFLMVAIAPRSAKVVDAREPGSRRWSDMRCAFWGS
jgi:hypothetical protein